MERNNALIKNKYYEYLFSTLAMTGSTVIANIIDRIIVGNLLGPDPMTAISLTSPVVFIANMIYGLCIYGGNTLSATYKGRRDKEKADRCFTISIWWGIIICAILTLAGLIFFDPLASTFCGGNEQLIEPVRGYLFPLLFVGALSIWTNGMTAFLRSDGLKKLAVAIPVISNVINLIADFVFIKVMGFGIQSAGWATNIGMMIAGLFVLPYFWSEKRTVSFDIKGLFDCKLILETFLTGLSSAALNGSQALKNYLLNILVIASLGRDGAVIMSVCLTGNMVARILYMGTAQTMMPIGGALYGEKDYNGIRYLFSAALKLMILLCTGLMVLLMLIPRQFADLFGIDIGTLTASFIPAFRIFCISIPVVGLLECFRSLYQSSGYRNSATVMMILDSTVCFIPFCFLFAELMPNMIWLTFTISPVLSLAAVYIFLRIWLKDKGSYDSMLLPVESQAAECMEFTMQNNLDDLERASMEVLDFCKKNSVEDTVGNKLWLGIQELCSNIIRYAYAGKEGSADIFLMISGDEIILRIRDNGVIFNPVDFIDESGREFSGLNMLKAMKIKMEYNRVIGFNNTIVTVKI